MNSGIWSSSETREVAVSIQLTVTDCSSVKGLSRRLTLFEQGINKLTHESKSNKASTYSLFTGSKFGMKTWLLCRALVYYTSELSVSVGLIYKDKMEV